LKTAEEKERRRRRVVDRGCEKHCSPVVQEERGEPGTLQISRFA
jgi:hypothetical protein